MVRLPAGRQRAEVAIVHVDVRSRVAAVAIAAAVVSITFGCANAAAGRKAKVGYVQVGRASYYGKGFVGKRTASGEIFDPNLMTAAHKTLPMGTRVRVTRRSGGLSVIVRVNDRCGCTHGRIIDVSEGAARKLDMIRVGVVPVRLEVIGRDAKPASPS
jgi:rare lipoprotein A